MRAVRRMTVRPSLPEPLSALGVLAANLRWTWHQPTRNLFAAVDPAVWQASGGDPLRVLADTSRDRLAELADDADFRVRVVSAQADLERYLTEPRWYQAQEGYPAAVAYFSMEFGVTEALPIYSGGLGVLAGDHLKAASDLGVPLVAVGLLYHAGYFHQSLSPEGWQVEQYPTIDPGRLPLVPLTENDGTPVVVRVTLPDERDLVARIWQARVGRVPLLLLDSDVAENDHELRAVTDRLYGGDQEHRIRQEILAGVGGVRAVRAFCRRTGHPEPSVFHTNEGHAGFLGLERIRELAAAGLDFDQALGAARAGTVFTTHTPVPAGIDRFPIDLVRRYFDRGHLLPGVDTDRILALGAEEDPGVFNMAHMGLRLAQRANGVSALHGEVSRDMFRALWPGFDVTEVPITSITNGVHGPTWTADEALVPLDSISDRELWTMRGLLRARLVAEVRRRVRASWLRRGATALELGWTDTVFDPDVLTIGFARRVPTYKRLTLMLRDPDRLRSLLLDPARPIQLVVAGKSHPADDPGKSMIQEFVRYADDLGVRHRIVFLPDYDMSMARYLYWGCDVWLNNPTRPMEACGTSGMKSALNGGLNLSIRDGWWDEMYDGDNGWAIPTADGLTDTNRRDELEASALYGLLDREVTPAFYERTAEGLPVRWLAMVRHTMATLGPRVQASRMVREYVRNLYVPAARSAGVIAADGFRGARDLAAYRERLREHWTAVRVVDFALNSGVAELGASVSARAEIDHGSLAASDVDVQLVCGRVDGGGELYDLVVRPMAHQDDGGYTASMPLPYAGSVGYTVRVLPRHDLLATPAELGRVILAN